jgi:hypothetical protein
MSVIPAEVKRTEGSAGFELRAFWQKFAHALDQLVVNRSYRAVPALALRRAKHDRDRCRRLMGRG